MIMILEPVGCGIEHALHPSMPAELVVGRDLALPDGVLGQVVHHAGGHRTGWGLRALGGLRGLSDCRGEPRGRDDEPEQGHRDLLHRDSPIRGIGASTIRSDTPKSGGPWFAAPSCARPVRSGDGQAFGRPGRGATEPLVRYWIAAGFRRAARRAITASKRCAERCGRVVGRDVTQNWSPPTSPDPTRPDVGRHHPEPDDGQLHRAGDGLHQRGPQRIASWSGTGGVSIQKA